MNLRTYVCIAASVAAVGHSRIARAQSGESYTESFVLVAGASDTADVERFTRKGPNIAGELVNRGSGLRANYTMTVNDSGLVPHLSLAVHAVGDSPLAAPKQAATFTFGRDSATVEVVGGPTQRIATPAGAIPWLNPSFVIAEQIVRRARVLDPKKKAVGLIPLVNLSGGGILSATVNWVGADSAVVSVGGVDIRLGLDASGRVVGARVPAQNVTVVRSGKPGP